MTWQIAFVYALVVGAVALFFSGRIRLDLTAALVIIALALSGILTPAEAVSGFGNPLVMLIAGLFIVSEGLSRTGVAAAVGFELVPYYKDGARALAPGDFLIGFGNEALVAICALMMVGKALETTGSLQPLANVVGRAWASRPVRRRG